MKYALLLLCWALPALAQPMKQPTCEDDNRIVTLQPGETDTFAGTWTRTLAADGATVEVVLIGVPPQPDMSPGAIVTNGPVSSGETLSVTLAPDTGCVTSGCRNGNWYQITLKAVDADGNQPWGDFCLHVKKKVYAP